MLNEIEHRMAAETSVDDYLLDSVGVPTKAEALGACRT